MSLLVESPRFAPIDGLMSFSVFAWRDFFEVLGPVVGRVSVDVVDVLCCSDLAVEDPVFVDLDVGPPTNFPPEPDVSATVGVASGRIIRDRFAWT